MVISLGSSLSVDPNIMDLLHREHSQILVRIGMGMENWLSTYKTHNISETAEDTAKVIINGL